MKITKTEKSLLGLFLIKEIVAIFFTPFSKALVEIDGFVSSVWCNSDKGVIITKHPAVPETAHYYNSFDTDAHSPVVEIAVTILQITSNSLLIYSHQSLCSVETVGCGNYG